MITLILVPIIRIQLSYPTGFLLNEQLYNVIVTAPMISLLVLVASAACAPQYGPPPPLPPTRPPPVPTPSPSPEKLIAQVTPAVACTVAYVTVWDTEYHDHENEVCET